METIRHPLSGAEIKGMRLVTGAVLQKGDKFDATSGLWAECPSPGIAIGIGVSVVWVRERPLTASENELLQELAGRWSAPWHVARRQNSLLWQMVPTPGWNGDDRLATPTIEHPERLRELADRGLLSWDFHQQVQGWGRNEVYSLTPLGLELGRQLTKA